MKLLIIAFATALSIAMPCIAMQEPEESPLTITMSHLLRGTDQYEIQLFDGKLLVGLINYIPQQQKPNAWKLMTFKVHRDYRKIGLGLALFKECTDDIKSKGGTCLEWEAQPQDDIISLDTLIFIYKRMIIKKLHYPSEALFVGQPEDGYIKEIKMRLQL